MQTQTIKKQAMTTQKRSAFLDCFGAAWVLSQISRWSGNFDEPKRLRQHDMLKGLAGRHEISSSAENNASAEPDVKKNTRTLSRGRAR